MVELWATRSIEPRGGMADLMMEELMYRPKDWRNPYQIWDNPYLTDEYLAEQREQILIDKLKEEVFEKGADRMLDALSLQGCLNLIKMDL